MQACKHDMCSLCKHTTHLALFKARVSEAAARLAGLGASAVGIRALQKQQQKQQQDKVVNHCTYDALML
jgi:hypothetical protein